MVLWIRTLRAMGVVATLVCLAVGHGRAATLLVANDGVDGSLCGSKAAPCRSISRAITNAGAGDRIVVGPGHYGDLDGDATLGETGEEQGGTCGNPPGSSIVVLCIDKPVTVLSRDGAHVTVIDGGGDPHDFVVMVRAPGAALGAPKKGFTVKDVPANGLFGVILLGSGATAAGNRVTARGSGLALDGTGHVAKGNQVIGSGSGIFATGTGHQIEGNEAVGNVSSGFGLTTCKGCRLVGNSSQRNEGNGFGIFADSSDLLLEGNVATANGGAGFLTQHFKDQVVAGVIFRGNVAVRNGGSGFSIDGTDLTLTVNAAIGNAVAGVQIAAESDAPLLSRNNFVGNGSDGAGCGVSSAAASPVEATDSYWGASTGPGPRPADAACGDPAEVVATPFATKPIKVKPKLPRIE